MAQMPVRIAAAGNVEVPAYLTLLARGYSVTREMAGGHEFWHAEKTGARFTGEGPLHLLGLVALHESRGENWRASDNEIDEFLRQFS